MAAPGTFWATGSGQMPHAEGMNNDKPETVCLNNSYRVFNLLTAAKIARTIGKTAEAAAWEKQAETYKASDQRQIL